MAQRGHIIGTPAPAVYTYPSQGHGVSRL